MYLTGKLNKSYVDLRNFCTGLKAFNGRVFNVAIFFENMLDVELTTYLYPSLLGVSCMLHLLMLGVLMFKIQQSNGSIIMMCISFSDLLVSVFMIAIAFTYFAGGFRYDFLPVSLCRFIIIAVETIPTVFHALSNYFLVALLLDRFFILAYPLIYKRKYDKKLYVFIYCICVTMLMIVTSSPCLIGTMNYPIIPVASKLDNTKTIDTLLLTEKRYLCDVQTISITLLIQKVLPVSICIILEIRCISILLAHRRNLKNMASNSAVHRSLDLYKNLTNATICMAGGSFLSDIPYLVAMVFVITRQINEIKTLYLIVNIFSTCSYITASAVFLLTSANIRKAAASLVCRCLK